MIRSDSPESVHGTAAVPQLVVDRCPHPSEMEYAGNTEESGAIENELGRERREAHNQSNLRLLCTRRICPLIKRVGGYARWRLRSVLSSLVYARGPAFIQQENVTCVNMTSYQRPSRTTARIDKERGEGGGGG